MSLKIDARNFQRDLDKIVKGFDTRTKKKILRASTHPLVREMKSDTSYNDYTGEYRKSIKPKTWRRSEDYFVGGIKGGPTKRTRTRRGKKLKDTFHPFYFRFINEGFYNTWSKRRIPGTNSIEKAISRATSSVVELIIKGIERYVIK